MWPRNHGAEGLIDIIRFIAGLSQYENIKRTSRHIEKPSQP